MSDKMNPKVNWPQKIFFSPFDILTFGIADLNQHCPTWKRIKVTVG